MRSLFNKAASPIQQRQASLSQEAEELEFELSILKNFLNAAPQLQEESRYLIPPPEDMAPTSMMAPNRSELKRMQRQSYYYGAKLLILLSLFLLASIWFVDRMLTVMR